MRAMGDPFSTLSHLPGEGKKRYKRDNLYDDS